MTERWRCFVAVPIDEALRGRLATACEAWRSHPEGAALRWTEPAGWHLTLAFIGLVPLTEVPQVAASIERVARRAEPVRLAPGGLGAFPSPRRARVLWYGVTDPDGRLAAIARGLATALGLEPATPYRPHITLARARRDPVAVLDLLAQAHAPAGTIQVERIELMRSHPGRGPARYERLASVELEVATHV